MSKKGLGLPQTKGEFKLRGSVTGMLRDNAFKSIQTKTDKEMQIVNFGVETNKNSTTYVQLMGMERDVYFYKRPEEKGKKGTTKKVAWQDRFEDQGDGFGLIGVRVGLEKGEDGKNIVETITEYDGAEKLYQELTDGTPVMAIGELDFNSYTNKEGVVRKQKNFSIKQIYAAKDMDFDSEDFVEVNDFKQRIIYMGAEIVRDPEDQRAIISAKIVNYDDIQDTEFVVRDKVLANTFKSKLKPYTAITVWGKIINKVEVEEEEQKDIWGAEDPTKNIKNNYIRELEVIGADPETIDTETYTKEAIDEALRADKEFGVTGDAWGSVDSSDDDLTNELPW